MIALTIDEERHGEDRRATSCAIARRLVDFACDQHGLAQSDLLIDPLTFTIATGNEDDRKLGALDARGDRARSAREFPDIQIILGLSNISFGLNPAARAVLNSVFLDHALQRRHDRRRSSTSRRSVPLHLIAPEEVQVAEDLIFDRRREGYDPLQRLLALFADRKAADAGEEAARRDGRGAPEATASSTATARAWTTTWTRRCRRCRRSTSSTTSCSTA